ncbi:hypothetical protein HPP92_022259 [Vanilla planifolia]|uniref:Uncharacterized protein n=1 Tax=Vanilla planifolia TaxID=51239 RepID=A0A835UH22_VANPL|nr:hypothetical protein HPP92_022259 [Vanilla planifolia]
MSSGWFSTRCQCWTLFPPELRRAESSVRPSCCGAGVFNPTAWRELEVEAAEGTIGTQEGVYKLVLEAGFARELAERNENEFSHRSWCCICSPNRRQGPRRGGNESPYGSGLVRRSGRGEIGEGMGADRPSRQKRFLAGDRDGTEGGRRFVTDHDEGQPEHIRRFT